MVKLLLAFRWIALAIAFLLNIWDASPAGFAHEPEAWIAAAAVYNAVVTLVLLRWRRLTPRQLLVADSLVFTGGVVMTGGWHSSLYVLYFLIVLGAALQLRHVESLSYALAVGFVYAAACILLPNWEWELTAVEVVASRVTVLLFAGVATIALSRQLEHEQNLRKAEEDVNSRLMVLNELMSLELGSRLDLDKTLEGIARLARRAISAEFSAVCLSAGPENSQFRVAFDGVPAQQQATMFREAQLDPIGEVVARTGQPLLITDISRLSEGDHTLPGFFKCRTLVCAPIKLDDEVLGVLYNGVNSPERIQQSDMELLVTMGRHTALAIVNAQMYDRERSNVVRLEKLEQMKSEFLSTVSHQLKTPITSIATSADLLQDSSGSLSEDQKRLVHNIARNAVRLDNLVTDLLQMARLKDGRVQLSLSPLRPGVLVSDAVSAVRLLFEAKDQTVKVLMDPALPRVLADRRRVEHVLVNLLSNGCRYTQREGTVSVEGREIDGSVEFAVRDDGPGMDRAVMERAFEPFFSATGPEGQGGTGLGLAIAKGLIELHGGAISIDSSIGTGTTVRFTLPVAQESKPTLEAEVDEDSDS
ncbi:MAG TPA: ATP-binding protein [Chloroflexota bacterium]|nr:ATP-binding protein [Chloroflexota bacterium]